MTIYLGADHGGFEYKEFLKEYFDSKKIPYIDEGAHSYEQSDDYIEYAAQVAHKVLADPDNIGIVICRNGGGVSITANKIKGIRASVSFAPGHAASLRKDDHANILALPADYITKEEALKIVDSFLSHQFSQEERHIRRVKKVKKLENDNSGNS